MEGNRYARLQREFEETREAIFENLCILRLISPTRLNSILLAWRINPKETDK